MSRMIKLLALVAVVGVLVLPAIVTAQDAAPYKSGDEVKSWTVKKTFTIDEKDYTFSFTLKRAVTDEPKMEYYLKEAKEFYTWKEALTVTGPTEPADLGYFTIRYGEAPKAKIYKATPPAAPVQVEPVKTGWKRGLTTVRTK